MPSPLPKNLRQNPWFIKIAFYFMGFFSVPAILLGSYWCLNYQALSEIKGRTPAADALLEELKKDGGKRMEFMLSLARCKGGIEGCLEKIITDNPSPGVAFSVAKIQIGLYAQTRKDIHKKRSLVAMEAARESIKREVARLHPLYELRRSCEKLVLGNTCPGRYFDALKDLSDLENLVFEQYLFLADPDYMSRLLEKSKSPAGQPSGAAGTPVAPIAAKPEPASAPRAPSVRVEDFPTLPEKGR